MKSLKVTGLFASILLFCGSAQAQSNPSSGQTLQSPTSGEAAASTPSAANVPTNLSLDEAIHSAIERNYTVRTFANNVERSSLEATRAKDLFLPGASASASYGYNYSLIPLSERTFTLPGDSMSGVPQRQIVTAAGSNRLSYNIGASYNIFNGGSDAARVRAAGYAIDAANGNLVWTRQQIAFNVTNDYLNALRSRELVSAAEQTLAESRAQLTRQQGLYQAGSIAIAGVYQQEAIVGQNELSLIQAQNNFENAKADLLFQINIPPNEYRRYNLSLTGIDTSTTAARRAAVDTTVNAQRIDAVINSRADIIAARQTISSAEESIAITRGALLPSVDATAGFGGSGANSDLFKTHITNSLSAGLSVQIPIFDRYQNELLIQEQEIDIENRRIALEQQVQGIRSDAAKAANNIASAVQALDASERGLRSAEESMRLASERLRVGAGTQVDVIIAQSQLENARTNRVNAKFNYVLAQRQLQYTLGEWTY